MPESATATAPSSAPDFTPLPVQQDSSSGSAPPIVPGASPREIDVGKAAQGVKQDKGGSGMDDSMSDLDRLFAETEAPKAAAEAKGGKVEKEQGSDEKPPGEASDAKEEGSGEKSAEGNGKAVSAPELRKAYEALKKEAAELREKVKSRGPSEDQVKELQTFKEQYESEYKRRQELEKELAQSAYERSPEFNEKHAGPFRNAYQNARNRISQFKVTDSEGNSRQASPDDFDAIMQIGDDMQAATAARELFGDTVGPIVMMQREKVQELHGSMQKAIADAETNFTKHQQEQKVTQERKQAHLNKLWTTLNTGAAEKYPQLFKPVDGDEKGNELLQRGYELVDKVFMDGSQMDPEETIKLHSQVRNRAAAFGRLVYQNRTMSEKIAALEKELNAFKDSAPKNGDGRTGKKGEGELFGEDGLERYVDR